MRGFDFRAVKVRNVGKIDSSHVKELLYVREGNRYAITPILVHDISEDHEEADSDSFVSAVLEIKQVGMQVTESVTRLPSI